MIFAWIYDGVKKSREQVGKRYYHRTGNAFRPSYDSGTRSTPTADRLKVPAAEAKPPRETTVKPAPAAEKPLLDTENLPVPEPKTPQEVEAEHQQMLARLRTELQEQVCAIHADVTLQPDREQGSEAAEQQLHILLYQTDVPSAGGKKPSIRAHPLRMCFR